MMMSLNALQYPGVNRLVRYYGSGSQNSHQFAMIRSIPIFLSDQTEIFFEFDQPVV